MLRRNVLAILERAASFIRWRYKERCKKWQLREFFHMRMHKVTKHVPWVHYKDIIATASALGVTHASNIAF